MAKLKETVFSSHPYNNDSSGREMLKRVAIAIATSHEEEDVHATCRAFDVLFGRISGAHFAVLNGEHFAAWVDDVYVDGIDELREYAHEWLASLETAAQGHASC